MISHQYDTKTNLTQGQAYESIGVRVHHPDVSAGIRWENEGTLESRSRLTTGKAINDCIE